MDETALQATTQTLPHERGRTVSFYASVDVRRRGSADAVASDEDRSPGAVGRLQAWAMA
jgi:hypothetical protein